MLDKNHPLPLYHQLKQTLRERIEQGEWKPGQRIPSERELCETYRVSRMTVRQAVTELVNENLLWRDQGRGTFVSKPKIQKLLSRLTSFTEDMRARGKQAGARVLRLELAPAKPAVAHALQIAENQPVVLIERLRLADDEPVGIETSHLSFERCEAILHEDLSRSLYELLTSKFGQFPTHAEEQLEAAACSAHEAELLGVRRGTPVLSIKRTTLNQELRPIEYVESTYRGDRYVFYARLSVDHP